MKMSPMLSGLLSDVIYKEEEVEMSPKEASLLQEEINNISEQIESDTTDLSIVSKSLSRVLELTEDMNTAVDTDTTDKYTAGLLLSEFASIYKDTMGQEFLYSKNLSDNPLEVKQILTAGLQSAGNFIETLKKIAKKIWESLKAGYAWFISKVKGFIKWIVSKMGLMKSKSDEAINASVTAEALDEAYDGIKKDAIDILDKLEKEQEDNSNTLDQLIKDAEKLGETIDSITEDKLKKMKLKPKIALKNSREVFGFGGKIKTKEAAKEFTRIILAKDTFKALHKNMTEDEQLMNSVLKLSLTIAFSAPELRLENRDVPINYGIDLHRDVLSKIHKNAYLPSSPSSLSELSVNSDGALEQYMMGAMIILENSANTIRERAEMQYDSILELFKKAKNANLDDGDKKKYEYPFKEVSELKPVTTELELNISTNQKEKSVYFSCGGMFGGAKSTVTVTFGGYKSLSGKKVTDRFSPVSSKMVDFDALGKKFEQSLKETEWFMDYFLNATKEELILKGENLINNLFVIVQNLNTINPSTVMSIVAKLVNAGNEFYDNLNIESRLLEIKKNN